MEESNRKAAAGSVSIEDVTTDEINRSILHRLEEKDPSLVRLHVTGYAYGREEYDYYLPDLIVADDDGAQELELLGNFVGENTALQEFSLTRGFNMSIAGPFFRGFDFNRSIQKMDFQWVDLEYFQWLHSFFENNKNLSHLCMSCDFGAGCFDRFLLALRAMKSLKRIEFCVNDLGGGELVDMIDILNSHSQLESLQLECMNVGTNECLALANILSSISLRELALIDTSIDDEGVEVMGGGYFY